MRSHFHHQGWLGGLPVAQPWNVLVKPMVSLRACGARPSAGDRPRQDGLMGESPEMSRKAVFPEGRGLRVRVARPYASPGISFPPHVSKMTRGPSGDMCQLGPSHPCGRAEPAPPRMASPARMALRRKARRRGERRLFRRDALCASAWQGHTQAEA